MMRYQYLMCSLNAISVEDEDEDKDEEKEEYKLFDI